MTFGFVPIGARRNSCRGEDIFKFIFVTESIQG